MKDDITPAHKESELDQFSLARAAANAMGRLPDGHFLALGRAEIEALCAHCPPLRSFVQRAVEEYS